MALTSIMSGNDEPPQRVIPTDHSRHSSKGSAVQPLAVKQEPSAPLAPTEIPISTAMNTAPKDLYRPELNGQMEHDGIEEMSSTREQAKKALRPHEADVQATLHEIEAAMNISGNFGPSLDQLKQDYATRIEKRALELENAEVSRRKVNTHRPCWTKLLANTCLAPPHCSDQTPSRPL